MDEQARVAHALRRFGLGAGYLAERAFAGKTGTQVVEHLLNDNKLDEGFPVSYWEFAAQPDGKVESGSYLLGGWWALRMLITKRPFQERLTLFWHDHFAIQYEKVYEAPMVAEYLDVLRDKGRGKFADLLKAVIKQGAMLMYLDNHVSNRLHPNENLAREVLELFTMGEGGGYSETDVRELSRALTGLTLHYLGSYRDEPYELTRMTAVKARMALSNVCFVPALHDDGQKVILGKRSKFTPEEALDLVASHPATARYICGKLWTWFAGGSPTDKELMALTTEWKRTDGDIKSVLSVTSRQPRFWTARSAPKSPVDWYVPIYRALGLTPALLGLRGQPTSDLSPIRNELREAGNGLHYLMGVQGQSLLNPPDVAGWEGGEAWLSSDNFIRRVASSGMLFWGGGDARPLAVQTASLLRNNFSPATNEAVALGFMRLFDFEAEDAVRAVMVAEAERLDALKVLSTPNGSANVFARLSRIIFATPSAQLA